MVASWVDPLVKTLYGVLSLGITAIGTAVCPPAAPFLSAGLAIGGAALGFIPMKGTEAEQQQAKFMENIRKSLEGINTTVWLNQELIEENQELIKDNQNILIHIQGMLDASAKENGQLIRGLHASLQQFETNMNAEFENFQAFLTEKSFNEETLQKINMVWHSMNRALKSQRRGDVEKFKTLFQKYKPKFILKSFTLGLGIPSKNPIVSAMEYDALNSRKVLENYMQVYSHLVVKVISMEGFYYGLTKGVKYATNLLSKENESKDFLEGVSATVEAALNEFIAHVSSYQMKEEKYWPSVVNKTILSATASISNGSPDTGKVADSIKKQLSGIYTTDVFSIYVYHCSSQPHLYSYDCKPWPLINFNLRDIDIPSYNEKMARFMIKAEKNNYHIIVLKSKTSKEVDYESATMVRISYNAYAQMIAPIEQQSAAQSMRESVGNDPLLGTLHSHFKSVPNLVNGFVAFGKITPEIRFTNNGTSVLPVGQGALPHKFYGLNWI